MKNQNYFRKIKLGESRRITFRDRKNGFCSILNILLDWLSRTCLRNVHSMNSLFQIPNLIALMILKLFHDLATSITLITISPFSPAVRMTTTLAFVCRKHDSIIFLSATMIFYSRKQVHPK